MLRRLRIYFTGVGIGLILVYVIFGRDDERDLDIWTPSQRILEDIRNDSLLQHGDVLSCYQTCLSLSEEDLEMMWTESDVKSLNPGGDPYRYLITLRTEERHLEAEVQKEKEKEEMSLVYIKDNQNPSVCDCP